MSSRGIEVGPPKRSRPVKKALPYDVEVCLFLNFQRVVRVWVCVCVSFAVHPSEFTKIYTPNLLIHLELAAADELRRTLKAERLVFDLVIFHI